MSIDVLRGIAIAGVLFMNISGMGGNSVVSSAPEVLGWTVADRFVWGVRHVLCVGTARCMLELLFGAGMVLLATRACERSGRLAAVRRFYVRSLVLVAIGAVHVFGLLWYGDFLHIYGLAALFVFPIVGLRPKWLIRLGLVYATVLAAFGVATAMAPAAPPHGTTRIASVARGVAVLRADAVDRAARRRFDSAVAREDRDRSSTPARWHRAMIDLYAAHFNLGWVVFGLGEAAATMMIGAGLFRYGVLQGTRSVRFYAGLAGAGYGVGLAIRLSTLALGHGDGAAFEIATGFREFGRLGMTLGHVAVVMLVLGRPWGVRLLSPFVAAGQSALSVYLCQTVLCLWLLFSPLGLALYGKLDWVALMAVAAGVNLLLLGASNVWMRYFAIAPIEWVWRSLAASALLPLRSHPMPATSGGAFGDRIRL